jgi:ATP phosphoribosyltransferase regulatory subunit
MPRWLLPESISDVLPSEARRIEELRRRLLDLYRSYGYELVMPPLVEFIDSLLTGSGRDLDLRTFKLIDQVSGRTMGLRADITPQVARIDAHLLDRDGVTRLCYDGSVLHARAAGPAPNREPLQVGAELFGHAGLEADLEVIELMLESLRVAGIRKVRIDLSHVDVVRTLLDELPTLGVDDVLPLLQSKDVPGLDEALSTQPAGAVRDGVRALASLHGQAGATLARARTLLPRLAALDAALDQLEALCGSPLLAARDGLEVEVAVDLGDLRGYRYHSGVIFAAYVDGTPNAVGRGGRYDNVGAAFGRARPATGFSLELRELAGLSPAGPPVAAILAPWSGDARLAESVRALRAAGEVVVQALPGHEQEHQEFQCDRELVAEGGRWVVKPLQRKAT